MTLSIKKKIYDFAIHLQKFPRSLTGKGNLQTLSLIKKILKKIKIIKVPSGYNAYDWKVPEEWDFKEAYIKNKKGIKILDVEKNFLHLVNYSTPIKKRISINELKKHIYTIPERPNAIPYVTSYYKKDWGFCMSQSQKKKLKDEVYDVYIDSKFKKGKMVIGEFYLKGKSKKEIFLSTYICHPYMANNEISGPTILTFLLNYFRNKKNYFSIRAVFLPETIGSIVYLSKNLKKLKKNVIAGFNLSCLGDERSYSYLPSREGNTLSDRVSKSVLKWLDKNYKKYTWLERGSDERQYCSPGIDLPIASVSRSKFGEYPEYHTSDDNFKKVVTSKGLLQSYEMYIKLVEAIQNNYYPKSKFLCEPKLSKYKLYDPTRKIPSSKQRFKSTITDPIINILTYADGKNSLLDISDKINLPIWELYNICQLLHKKKLISLKRKI
jgi:aminopeptidase-like protein